MNMMFITQFRRTPTAFTTSFFAVALLSGSLADSLRSAGVRLEAASSEIADLQALVLVEKE